MTTIAVCKDSMEIGSDLQYTEGQMRKWKGSPKVYQFQPHELTYPNCRFYIGFAGTAEQIVSVAEFFSRPETTKPPRATGLKGAILTEEGNIYCFDTYDKWLLVNEKKYAIGSGADVALGALHSGASVRDSIKAAMKVDPFTGLGIKVFKW